MQNARRHGRRAHLEVTSIIAIAHPAEDCTPEKKALLLFLSMSRGSLEAGRL
jgi:hypothetical protein